jgi:hypothetical protein
MSEATATQAVVFLRVSGLSAARCRAGGRVTFSVTYQGRLAQIKHNPITAAARPEDSFPDGTDVAHFWWANWCGPRKHIAVEATYRGRTVSAPPSFVPDCIARGKPSTLLLPA